MRREVGRESLAGSECPLMAISGPKGGLRFTSALPPKADIKMGAVDLRLLHPSKQTYRIPMSAPGAIADHLQSGDRRRLVTLRRH